MVAGALPLHYLEADWPAGVPVSLHQSVDDSWYEDGANENFMQSVTRAGAVAEYYLYPGKGHLFANDELTDEYSDENTREFWTRVLRFIKD